MAFLCSSVTTLFAAYMTLNFLMKCSETIYLRLKTRFNSLNNWLATWSSMTLNIFPLLTLNHSTESIQQRWNQKDWRRPWWTAAFRWALIARKHFSSAAVYILNIYILYLLFILYSLVFRMRSLTSFQVCLHGQRATVMAQVRWETWTQKRRKGLDGSFPLTWREDDHPPLHWEFLSRRQDLR